MCRVGKGLAVFKVPFFVVGSSFLRFLFYVFSSGLPGHWMVQKSGETC